MSANRIAEIKKRLERWQDELPKLIQPEREHIQNISDIAYLLGEVERLKADQESYAVLRVLYKDLKVELEKYKAALDVAVKQLKPLCGCDYSEQCSTCFAIDEIDEILSGEKGE